MDARECAIRASEAAVGKKAHDVIVLDLSSLTIVTDFFVICSGQNPIQVKAIADNVVESLAAAGRKPRGMEGYEGGRWVLIDYGDVVVHVFHEEERDYYSLERLWGDAAIVGEEAVPVHP